MKIRVNFRDTECRAGMSVAELLADMQAEEKYRYFFTDVITVVLNNKVLPASAFSSTMLSEGDELRIYPLIAGG